MTEIDRTMNVSLRVDVRTRRDGDYYTGTSDVLRHVKMWIEDGLSDRDDLEEVTVTELPPDIPEELKEPDHPAARALASYIESHSASTVMAALRYLGWKLDFELALDDAAESSFSLCSICQERILWVGDAASGHWEHFEDEVDHTPQPAHCECPAALLPPGSAPVKSCVVYGKHTVHRAADGEAWTQGKDA